jgi:hypothetical protein
MIDFDQLWFKLINELFLLTGSSHSTHWMFTMLIYDLKLINLKCLIILKYIKLW